MRNLLGQVKKIVWHWSIIKRPECSEANKIQATNENCVSCTVVSLSVTDMSFSHEQPRTCGRLYVIVQNMTAVIENNAIVI